MGRRAASFLGTALLDCEKVLEARPAGGCSVGKYADAAASGRRRPRPDDGAAAATRQDEEDERRFWADARAEATKGLDAIAAILRRPEVAQALASLSGTWHRRSMGSNTCNVLLEFAVKRGCMTSGELQAMYSAVEQRFAKR